METTPHPLLMHSEKVLALITARAGSKGLVKKNLLLAGGKPLIAWTIEAALSASTVSRVVLSSEDDEIIASASFFGCDVPFRRPVELASDEATSIDVVLHALKELPGYDYVVLLQPTSPLRTSSDIDAAFKIMLDNDAPSCVSVSEVDQSPYWMYHLSNDGKLISLFDLTPKVSRRQDLPVVYALNGAIYIAKIDWLLQKKSFLCSETIAYKMPKNRSLDIDDAIDFHRFLQAIKSSDRS